MNDHGVLVLCGQRDVRGPARGLWGPCSSGSWPVAHLYSLELPEQTTMGRAKQGQPGLEVASCAQSFPQTDITKAGHELALSRCQMAQSPVRASLWWWCGVPGLSGSSQCRRGPRAWWGCPTPRATEATTSAAMEEEGEGSAA